MTRKEKGDLLIQVLPNRGDHMGKLKCKSSCHNNTENSCIPFLVYKKIICGLFEILNCHGSDLIHLKLGARTLISNTFGLLSVQS